jgi:O-methyltransferase involved in polyketide biosynthesis
LDGIGLTAPLVAAARAIETRHPEGLVADPYAESFVTSADTPLSCATHIGEVAPGRMRKEGRAKGARHPMGGGARRRPQG